MGMTEQAFETAKNQYAALGVDVDRALDALASFALSVHCWQGDDVGGFETPDAELGGGGIQVTGNYPGKARTVTQLRQDLEKMYSLLPGNHRLSLHASYGEFGGERVDRDKIAPEHFTGWVDWAKANDVKLDFNATCFSHPMADDGFTLSSKDPSIRGFWIEHIKRCREISAYFGRELSSPCIHNVWIPDGTKDYPVDRNGYRKILVESLDESFAHEYAAAEMKDAVESKLFGIGSEAFVVGSHEFYMGYALTRGKLICIDMGHFHPTELIADKISAIMQFTDEMLLHVSRSMRWDSDHVVILNDDVRLLAEEIVRSGKREKIHIGLDFFDASINRIGAWAVGSRSTLKALLLALLQPQDTLMQYEQSGNNFARMALTENLKAMPFGAVWDRYCTQHGAPVDAELIRTVMEYEKSVLSDRE